MGPCRVVFIKPFIYTPSLERRVSTKFKAGRAPYLVTGECAERALAEGAAELWQEIPAPAARLPAKRRTTGRRKRFPK